MTEQIDFLRRSNTKKLIASGTKIVGFGAGVIGLKTIRYLDNPFHYFVDNSKDKVQRKWKEYTDDRIEVPVHHFSHLKKEEQEKIAVIICSEHYEEMADQLLANFPDVNVFLSPLLKDFGVFSKLLKCSENILVSAYGGSGGLYLLNGRTKEYKLLSPGSFRGLTRYNDRVIVSSEKGDIMMIESFVPFKVTYLHRSSQRTNVHGILYWKELDSLFVSETINDCISVYRMDPFEKKEEIPLSEKSIQKGHDYHHINDLCLYNGKLYSCIVSKSGNFNNNSLDGAIFELDYKNSKQFTSVCEELLFPHAVSLIDRRLAFLNSFDGNLMTLSGKSLIHLPGFIRGIDEFNNLIYIGQSRHRRLEKADLYFNGVSMDSGVYVIDLKTKIHRFIHLPEMCDVFNLMVIDDLL